MQKEIRRHFVQYLQITSEIEQSRREKGGPGCGPLASDRVRPKEKGEGTRRGGARLCKRVYAEVVYAEVVYAEVRKTVRIVLADVVLAGVV